MAKEEPQDPTPIEVEEAGSPAPAVPAAAAVKASAEQQSMLNVMRDKFAAERRVPVKVHNDGPVTVQVNGYTFLIRENVRVEVPESIAQLLDDAGYI